MSDEEHDQSNSKATDLQDFSLVQFTHRGRKKKVEAIDIVPTKWLEYDKKSKRMFTKFLESPYSDEDIKMLHALVRDNVDAPTDWPTYPVKVVGRATTYALALIKVKRLETEEHVLTAESDESFSGIQDKIKSAVHQNALNKQALLLKEKYSNLPGKAVNDKSSTSETLCSSKDRPNQKNPNHDKVSELTVEGDGKSTVENEITATNSERDGKSTVETETTATNSEGNGKSTVENETTESNSPPAAGANTVKPREPENGTDVAFVNSNVDIGANTINAGDGYIMGELQYPMVQVESYESKSDFETIVLASLRTLTTEIKNLKTSVEGLAKKQDETTEYLKDKKVVQNKNSAIDFSKKYNLPLPIQDMDTFNIFDDDLKNNAFLKTDVYLEMTSLVDSTGCITKSFYAILKKFIAKSIALQFTAVRRARDPTKEQNHPKFKDTELYKCMSVVMTAALKKRNLDATDKQLISGLSAVFCNAKRWD